MRPPRLHWGLEMDLIIIRISCSWARHFIILWLIQKWLRAAGKIRTKWIGQEQPGSGPPLLSLAKSKYSYFLGLKPSARWKHWPESSEFRSQQNADSNNSAGNLLYFCWNANSAFCGMPRDGTNSSDKFSCTGTSQKYFLISIDYIEAGCWRFFILSL